MSNNNSFAVVPSLTANQPPNFSYNSNNPAKRRKKHHETTPLVPEFCVRNVFEYSTRIFTLPLVAKLWKKILCSNEPRMNELWKKAYRRDFIYPHISISKPEKIHQAYMRRRDVLEAIGALTEPNMQKSPLTKPLLLLPKAMNFNDAEIMKLYDDFKNLSHLDRIKLFNDEKNKKIKNIQLYLGNIEAVGDINYVKEIVQLVLASCDESINVIRIIVDAPNSPHFFAGVDELKGIEDKLKENDNKFKKQNDILKNQFSLVIIYYEYALKLLLYSSEFKSIFNLTNAQIDDFFDRHQEVNATGSEHSVYRAITALIPSSNEELIKAKQVKAKQDFFEIYHQLMDTTGNLAVLLEDDHLIKIIFSWKHSYLPNHPIDIKILLNVYKKERNYKELLVYQNKLAEQDKSFSTLFDLGCYQCAMCDFERAQKTFTDALKIISTLNPIQHLRYLDAFAAFNDTLIEQGFSVRGFATQETAKTHGRICYAEGNKKEAVELLTQEYEGYCKSLASDVVASDVAFHLELQKSLVLATLAMAQMETGKYDESLSNANLARDSLKLHEKSTLAQKMLSKLNQICIPITL